MQRNSSPGRPFKLVRKENPREFMPSTDGRDIRLGKIPPPAPVGYVLKIIEKFAQKLATVRVWEFLAGESH